MYKYHAIKLPEKEWLLIWQQNSTIMIVGLGKFRHFFTPFMISMYLQFLVNVIMIELT